METRTVTLPGGYIDQDATVHRNVQLAPFTGREEEYLADHRHHASASLVTTILSRCVQSIGTITPVTEDLVQQLLVADRQFLLLKLREMTFGDVVQATILCPWPNCGHQVDIDFSTRNIPLEESTNKEPTHIMTLSTEAMHTSDLSEEAKTVGFRLPNGKDQEDLAALANQNEAKALTALLTRCITQVGSTHDPESSLIDQLSPLARMEIEKSMEAQAPKLDLSLGANCPECHRDFTMPFDIQQFFFGEWQTSRDLLYREIHYLAYHYHWSEEEIMEFPREKRRKYIEILAEEIERLNNAV